MSLCYVNFKFVGIVSVVGYSEGRFSRDETKNCNLHTFTGGALTGNEGRSFVVIIIWRATMHMPWPWGQ